MLIITCSARPRWQTRAQSLPWGKITLYIKYKDGWNDSDTDFVICALQALSHCEGAPKMKLYIATNEKLAFRALKQSEASEFLWWTKRTEEEEDEKLCTPTCR